MAENIIRLPKPHPGQHEVISQSKRFNVLRMGRRWGKTMLTPRLLKPALTDNWKIGMWYPNYKDLHDVWRETKYRFQYAIREKSETLHEIIFVNGGSIDFWSMDDPNSGRGRKYHRAIIDEFCKARNGQEAWEQTIRPTLTDYMGDAWILSTPHYRRPYFKELCNNKDKFDNWMSWHMPTHTNPYIDKGELEEARKQLDPVIYAQEYLAEFVSMASTPFAYAFDEDEHTGECKLDPRLEVYLSFDFNVEPITCVAAQMGDDFIHIFKEFRLMDSDIYALCDVIKAELGSNQIYLVTGDASGTARDALVRGNMNYYTVIQAELDITSQQINVPRHNPSIHNSRVLLNAILARYPRFVIDKSCQYLVEDLNFVEADDKGGIDKGKDKHRSHLLDCLRYLLNTWKYDFLTERS